LKVYFVGLSKNCFGTLKNNIENLEKFNELYEGNCEIIVIDSDSSDGTKEYLNNYQKMNKNFILVEKDMLDNQFSNRIEKLSYCRNIGLRMIDRAEDAIYIPMDMDIDLFTHFNIFKFHKLVISFIEDESTEGIFPFSIPYYYDIFALRKKGWVEKNAVFEAHKLKQKYKIGSFLFNYFFVFNKQKKQNYFKQLTIRVESAFGGIGMYKLNKGKDYEYSTHESISNYYSEHIYFNQNFKKLFIYKDWIIDAPLEHIRYKNFNIFQKLIYIMKTVKYDLLTINKKGAS